MQNQQRRNRRRRGEGGDGQDEEEEIQYGMRRSRRETSWEYRDSSSLTPLQFMQREDCYFIAERMLAESISLAHVIVPLLFMYRYFNSLMHQLPSAARAQSIAYGRVMTKRLGEILRQLSFIMVWTLSYGEVALLCAQNLSFYIRHRHQYEPERNRTINELSRRDCYLDYTITKHQLRLLYRHWRIPDHFRSRFRHVFTGEECFLVYLFHLFRGTPFTEMARHKFGGNPRYFTYMFNAMNDHLYVTFYHKISGVSLREWLPDDVHHFRQLVYRTVMDGGIERTSFDNNEITFLTPRIPFDAFRIFALLDDSSIPTARPSDPDYYPGVDFQHSFYSGYFREHGLKCQLVYLPNGLIGSVFITELRQNDQGTQNMSGLNNHLLRLLQGQFIGGLPPALYCDGIFALLPCIIPRYTNPTFDQWLLNLRMASIREAIEWVFCDHFNWFRLFWTPQYMHVVDQGVKLRRMCLNSFFIQNCLYCLTGRRCRWFGQMPPTLAEYIPLGQELPGPPAVDLGNVWEFRPVEI